MAGSAWDVLIQGIQDTTGHFVGRRDRDHAEHREDARYAQDRSYFLKDRERAEHRADREIRRRVVDAKAAGLHPLTAMGINPASGSVHSFSPSQSTGGSTYYPRYSPVSAPTAPTELERAQARNLNAQTDLMIKQAQDSDWARIDQAITPDKLIEELRNPQRTTHVKIAGIPLRSASGFSDAQTYEDRYGEVGGSAIGLANIPADVLYNGYLAAKEFLQQIQKTHLFDSVKSFNAR